MKTGDKVYIKRHMYDYLDKAIFLITYKDTYYFTNREPLSENECELLTEKEGLAFNKQKNIKSLKESIKNCKKRLIECEEELAELTKGE